MKEEKIRESDRIIVVGRFFVHSFIDSMIHFI